MSGQKSDHRPTLFNCKAFSLLRTVNEQKNADILHIVNPCTYFMTHDKYLLDTVDDKKSHLKHVLRA